MNVLMLIKNEKVRGAIRSTVRLRGLHIRFMLMLFLLVNVGRANDLCYVFLFHGDVMTRCKGQLRRITFTGDVLTFSVDDRGQFLAITRKRNRGNGVTGEAAAQVVNLETGAVRAVKNPGHVIPSCGTLVLVGFQNGELASYDIEPTPLAALGAPLANVRCSSDRSAVVGQLSDRSQIGPRQIFRLPDLKRSVGASGRFDFNISPDGLHMAYHSSELCLWALEENAARCVDVRTTIIGTPSVKNGGGVLVGFNDYEGRECFYQTPTRFDTQRLPGGRSIADACESIGYWRPGLTRLQTLEPLGDQPQWITEAIALKIRMWGERLPKGVVVK